MSLDEPIPPVREDVDRGQEHGPDAITEPVRERLPLVPRGWLAARLVLIA